MIVSWKGIFDEILRHQLKLFESITAYFDTYGASSNVLNAQSLSNDESWIS
jgi:hypothetical protein